MEENKGMYGRLIHGQLVAAPWSAVDESTENGSDSASEFVKRGYKRVVFAEQ